MTTFAHTASTRAVDDAVQQLQGFDADELLLGYQKRWIADESTLKIAEKSRRTGLTWAEAADASLTASLRLSAGGGNHFYVGSNKEMAREFIDAVAMWAKAFNRAAGDIQEEVLADEDKDILTFVVYFASGFKVVALSSNPSNLRGMQGNVTIDEAAFHDRLGEVLKAALALTMWGSKVRLISTHNGVESLFNELINDSRAGKKDYQVHTITLDDACAEGLYRRICQVKGRPWSQALEDEWKAGLLRATDTEDDALEEYYCVPKASGGAWLSRALIESRMSASTPVLRYTCKPGFELLPDHVRAADAAEWLEREVEPLLATLNPDLCHFFGEDFGRTGDLTVLVPLTQQQNLTLTPPFFAELRNVPFRQQEQIVFYLLDRLPKFLGGAFDARGNGQYLAEVSMQRYGASRITQVMLTESWYREHMPPLKAALEDGTLTELPKDADILADLRIVQMIKGVPRIPEGRTQGKDKGARHGDAAVGVAMAHFASRELNKGPVSARSRGRRRSANLLRGY